MYLDDSAGDMFRIVEPGDTLSRIAKELLPPFASHNDWMQKTDELHYLNRDYIPNPNLIFPNQIIYLGPLTRDRCYADESLVNRDDILQFQREWQLFSPEKRQVFEDWSFLEILMQIAESPLTITSAVAATLRTAAEEYLKYTLKGMKPPAALVLKIERDVTYLIQTTLRQQIQNTLIEVRRQSLITIRRNIVVILKNPNLHRAFAQKMKLIKKILPRLGKARNTLPFLFATIEAGMSVADYQKATSEKEKDLIARTSFWRVSLGLVGSLVGGSLGTTICVGFGVPTLGIGAAVCALAGGVISGLGLGALGEYSGRKSHEKHWLNQK